LASLTIRSFCESGSPGTAMTFTGLSGCDWLHWRNSTFLGSVWPSPKAVITMISPRSRPVAGGIAAMPAPTIAATVARISTTRSGAFNTVTSQRRSPSFGSRSGRRQIVAIVLGRTLMQMPEITTMTPLTTVSAIDPGVHCRSTAVTMYADAEVITTTIPTTNAT
jgi:hypothetical protein